MVFAYQIAGLVYVEPSRRRQGALVWHNDQVLLLALQGFHGLASDERQDGVTRLVRNCLRPVYLGR
jgi:hypothetical protein